MMSPLTSRHLQPNMYAAAVPLLYATRHAMSLHSAVLFHCASVRIRSSGQGVFGVEKERRSMGSHRAYRERKYAFGEQLLTLRTRVALTQIELAEQVGVHRRSVQNWETGESYPKSETLQRLIAILLRNG